MTSKQKFEQYAKQEVWEKKNYNAEECEAIADEFAIAFAEWMGKKENLIHLIKIGYTTKELLEIYKKEKGL
jgi:hypothetical protein